MSLVFPAQQAQSIHTIDTKNAAAEKLGIDPASGQAHGWFGYGGRTGLMSPEATIPDLLNAQIEATARATGLHPKKILQLWGRGRIPLAEAPAADGQSQVG